MRTHTALALLLLFLATALSAGTVTVQPPAPTSATPVTLHVQEVVSCPPPPKITRSGNTFSVAIDPGICLTPPLTATFTFDLGLLQPGDYEVVVNGPQRSGYAAFFVSDANATLQAIPSIGPLAGGTEVTIFADIQHCAGKDVHACPPPVITFDGTPASVRVVSDFQFVAIAPAHAPGLVEVVVAGATATKRGRVFRYYDPDAAPSPTMFERILFPVFLIGPGAFGSQWVTQLAVQNNSPYSIEPYRRLAPSGSCPLPPPQCGDEGVIAPLGSMPLRIPGQHPRGFLFFVPRDFSGALHFGSLVSDSSRQTEAWGTEIPVVRENAFRSGAIDLLNIPTTANYRTAIRIYDVDSVSERVIVTVYSMDDGHELATKSVVLTSSHPCAANDPCASDEPAFGIINDFVATFPEVRGQTRVRVQIYAAGRAWAFASITNNVTQHVTIISPQ